MRHLSRLQSENDENSNVISAVPICKRIEENLEKEINDWVDSKIKNDTQEITVDLSEKVFGVVYDELMLLSQNDHEWARDVSIEINIMCDCIVHGFADSFDLFEDKDLFRSSLAKIVRKSIIQKLKYGDLRSFFMNKDIESCTYGDFNDYY